MPTITITDEELHEIVEVLDYRVTAYRHQLPPPSKEGIAWIDRYEARNKVLVHKLEGILNEPTCDPYHLKQVESWNKRLDALQEEVASLKIQLAEAKGERETLY